MLDETNITPTVAPPVVRLSSDDGRSGGSGSGRGRAFQVTRVVNDYSFSKSDDPPSGRSGWSLYRGGQSSMPTANVERDDRLERAAADRVRLLATKFEDQASAQDVARLEILTARLNRLAPRTTQGDIAKIEQTVNLIEQIDASLSRLADEYDN